MKLMPVFDLNDNYIWFNLIVRQNLKVSFNSCWYPTPTQCVIRPHCALSVHVCTCMCVYHRQNRMVSTLLQIGLSFLRMELTTF
jgi:hypothetical protein